MMEGTSGAVTYLVVLGIVCLAAAIAYVVKRQWLPFAIYAVFTVMALSVAYYKPSFDARHNRAQWKAEEQVLRDYPEIKEIIEMDRSWNKISYLDERGQKCKTTLVHRDDKWLVNTQTADCGE